jgi:hypothetical protein
MQHTLEPVWDCVKKLKVLLVHKKLCKGKIGLLGKNLKKYFFDFYALKNAKTHSFCSKK